MVDRPPKLTQLIKGLAHRIEGSRLVLAVLQLPCEGQRLFVHRERLLELAQAAIEIAQVVEGVDFDRAVAFARASLSASS